MEKTSTPNKLRPVGILLAFGAVALTAGCAAGSYEVTPKNPVHVEDEYTKQIFITSEQSGGYPHYEDVYHFIVQQCDRSDLSIADKNNCVELDVEVDKKTYDAFGPGDDVVFNQPLRGYPATNK